MDRLTEEEYVAWRSHPTTEKMRQYWRDYRAWLMELWAGGNITDERSQAYAQFLGDLEALTFQDIETFYTSQEEPREDEEPEQDQPA